MVRALNESELTSQIIDENTPDAVIVAFLKANRDTNHPERSSWLNDDAMKRTRWASALRVFAHFISTGWVRLSH